jgi:hypothetical protein
MKLKRYKEVVDLVKSIKDPHISKVTYTKYHLVTEFLDYDVKFCPRACNKPAHVLAVLGMGMDHNAHSIWVSDYPDVTRLVAGDIAVS